MKDEDESKISFVGGPLSNVVELESAGVTYEEAIEEVGLIWETDTILDTIG